MARKLRRPSVELHCPANYYATSPTERIIEFSWVNASGALVGGLISFHGHEDRLIVDIYRCDPGVEVRSAPQPATAQAGA